MACTVGVKGLQDLYRLVSNLDPASVLRSTRQHSVYQLTWPSHGVIILSCNQQKPPMMAACISTQRLNSRRFSALPGLAFGLHLTGHLCMTAGMMANTVGRGLRNSVLCGNFCRIRRGCLSCSIVVTALASHFCNGIAGE